MIVATSCTIRFSPNSSSSIEVRMDSLQLMSTIVSKVVRISWQAWLIRWAYSMTFAGLSAFFMSSMTKPEITLIGMWNSCDRLARK